MNTSTINLKIDQYTGAEIMSQPLVWKDVLQLVINQQLKISQFLDPILKKQDLQIILSGAGSSAFLGEAAKSIVEQNTGKITQAIATTDIVTHPKLISATKKPILLVSFGRSGNSPESMETINLSDEYCDEIYHLIITCNNKGSLAKYAEANPGNCYSFVLPEETHDKSLAMTSSFTSMLLSILLISDLSNPAKSKQATLYCIKTAEEIFAQKETLKLISIKDFDRVVFLGSGELLGIARECSLKLQELTDGQLICKHDSFLGFRHGPRAIVNDKTLMVFLFSNDMHVRKYEMDLVRSIKKEPRDIYSLSVGTNCESNGKSLNESQITISEYDQNEFFVVALTLIGQLLGYYRSLYLGLDPDNPSISGTISRVVQGVKIYKK